MGNSKSLIDEDGEVRELTDEDLLKFHPVSDVLPESLQKKMGVRGRPPKSNPKQLVSVRYSAEVLAYFKATGKGWQTRMDDVLRDYVDSH